MELLADLKAQNSNLEVASQKVYLYIVPSNSPL
jgi:hypothetical protein